MMDFLLSPVAVTSVLGVAGLGFVMGLRHALDADHVAAVSAIVSRGGGWLKATRIGVFWGLGHSATLLGVGFGLVFLKLTVPAGAALIFETVVGLMLIVLGLRAWRQARRGGVHIHTHAHDGSAHVHLHAHADSPSHNHAHVPFLVGMLHGLAGSAALAVLVMAASSSVAGSLSYMLAFAVGTMVGMSVTSAVLGAPLAWAARFPRWRTNVARGAGAVSVLVGTLIIWEMGSKLAYGG